VTVEVGFPLTALVTRGAAAELELVKGRAIFALVKASAVAPAWELTAKVRVSLVGRQGLVCAGADRLPERHRSDGLAFGAARELRDHFRTALGWARTLNKLWGNSLVARAPGGRGGGGTILTPEGKAAVRFASRVEKTYG
jgi:molybdate transport repressor ModE-like protein